MLSLLVIILLTILIVFYALREYRVHQRHLLTIPLRIHVNGTRGKSSVTRLIGAGLRASGKRIITKVTGTFPRIILPDGSEAVVHRNGPANILEQLEIIEYCAKEEADILIIECMALQPNFQKITEHQMIKADIGVITNIRLDHLDVMGPTLNDVARSICGTIPRRSKLFTTERRYLKYMEKVAKKRETVLYKSNADTVSDEDLQGFTYIEHKENVALALDICVSLGIERTVALTEMKKSIPDEGVLRRFTIKTRGKRIHFYNALAANDPESTLMIWKSVKSKVNEDEDLMLLLNSRRDRESRAIQLVELISQLSFTSIGLIGESLDSVIKICEYNGIDKSLIHVISEVDTTEKYQKLVDVSGLKTTILAIGNMGAGGAELSDYFEKHHQ